MVKYSKGPYSAFEIEPQIYKYWEDNNLFSPQETNSSDKVFSITMPPPNITGVLHLGHAMDLSLPDIVCRYKRMNGYTVCWFPGTDQAGLATDNKVEEGLRKKGINKYEIGREEFVKKAWEWKKEYGSLIIDQMKKLGISPDWSLLRFTKDEEYEKAVIKAFVTYYNEGLIYKGKRMVQYCPRCKTALSDIEVFHKKVKGELVYVKYFIENTDEYITIATTRIETMLGDSAVAVHPEDPRYKKYHNKFVVLPLVGRKIPIIADDYVDQEFGTGALKITPAHDPNDFTIGKRHKLDFITVIDEGKRISSDCGEYSNLTLEEAREKIKQDLEEQGYLIQVEPYEHQVGHCERCKHILEPIISDQWYLKTKSLAQLGMQTVKNNEIEFIPKRWTKVYNDWMEKILDWCISRQIWWGIRIPVWYCQDCGEIIVSESVPKTCPECYSTNLTQEEDVLDTWFGSALWPFACMGWPNDSENIQKYYPTSLMVTGFDIIFFWVSRMIFSSLHFINSIPFEKVYFHGLILDKTGKKMSKSSTNAVDPTSLINEQGADALRYTVTSYSNSTGQDIKFDMNKNKASRNFINKIWNAGNYVIEKTQTESYKSELSNSLSIWDAWIVNRFNHTLNTVSKNIDEYSFNDAANAVYSFFWHDFCDWYIEVSKSSPNQILLRKIFTSSLQLMHPIIPFVTEAMWLRLPENNDNSIMYSQWPTAIHLEDDQLYIATKIVPELQELIRTIRNIKSEFHLTNHKDLSIPYSCNDQVINNAIKSSLINITTLSRINDLFPLNTDPKNFIATTVNNSTTVYFPKDLINIDEEIASKKTKILKIEKELNTLSKKLSNKDFMTHAPEEIVSEVTNTFSLLEDKKKLILSRIKDLTDN